MSTEKMSKSSRAGLRLSEADIVSLRAKFPAFSERPDTVFFDNAATTQKPETVIKVIDDFYRRECANAGRGSNQMASVLAARIEEARRRVAGLIGASSLDIAFTSGATESLNKIALGWGLGNLKSGDEIMVCFEDHKSTVLPWLNLQRLLLSFGVEIRIIPIRLHKEGNYELASIREGKSERLKLVVMTHVHHVYGLDMEVDRVREIVGPEVLICLDASQSVGHRTIDVRRLAVDFLVFSGHKMFAANGVGVMWVSPLKRATLMPVTMGGGMHLQGQLLELKLPQNSLAESTEAGTANIPAILSLVPAIDLIESIGVRRIEKRLFDLAKRLYYGLKTIPGIEFSPGIDRCGKRRSFGLVAFRFEHVKSSDVGFLLDSENILVRTGDQCLSSIGDGDHWLRISLHVYNTEAEIDRLVQTLRNNLE